MQAESDLVQQQIYFEMNFCSEREASGRKPGTRERKQAGLKQNLINKSLDQTDRKEGQ